jgi:hypothetical protein
MNWTTWLSVLQPSRDATLVILSEAKDLSKI